MGINFDGNDDVINCGDSDGFSIGNGMVDTPFTIYIRFKCNSIETESFNSAADFLISKDNLSIREWSMATGESNKLNFVIFTSAGAFLQKRYTGLSINTWYSVIITYNGSGTTGVKFYINAINVVITDLSSGYTSSFNSSSPLAIGNWGYVGFPFAFNGVIAESAIWKGVELTAREIELITNSKIKYMPLQIQKNYLKGYWPMNDGIGGISADGVIVRDYSGNGNHGTGDNGPNNTGLTWQAESIFSYAQDIGYEFTLTNRLAPYYYQHLMAGRN